MSGLSNFISSSLYFVCQFIFAILSSISPRSLDMVLKSLPLFFFLSALPLLLALDPNVPLTCYALDGTKTIKAGFRCDNSTSGHSTCCAPGAICYSNGVCQQSNGAVQDYLRVGCTDKTWKDPACLEQCTTCEFMFLYLYTESGINLR
jgi:hypothetical protein